MKPRKPCPNAVRRYARRFHALALEGEAGRDWYADAQRWAQDTFGSRAGLVLRLLAATSPRASILANVRHTRRALADVVAGSLSGGYGVPANDANVARVARGEALTGPKVSQFGKALTGDPTAVTVDVWMLRAAGIAKDYPTTLERRAIVAATLRVARRLGWEARQVQAAVWSAARAALAWRIRKLFGIKQTAGAS